MFLTQYFYFQFKKYFFNLVVQVAWEDGPY